MKEFKRYVAGLYCRLSKDDEQKGESVSIGTQRSISTDYCLQHGYTIYKVYIDDGYSGLNFNRPGFKELLEDVERGVVNMVITKDLSRLGRDYIMTGYYSEIFFQTKGVRYIALADDDDSLRGTNEISKYVLEQIRDFARSIRRRKINSPTLICYLIRSNSIRNKIFHFLCRRNNICCIFNNSS